MYFPIAICNEKRIQISVSIGALVYGSSVVLLKVEEVNLIMDKVKGKLKK